MTWEPRNRVEDEDNNNDDDDSGRKSVDEKDRLGEYSPMRGTKNKINGFCEAKNTAEVLPLLLQILKIQAQARARTANDRRIVWICYIALA